MAINKNFVIKNGIQVNNNLFVADPDNNKIGINTALPDYELHVNGGIGATHALISGVTTSIGDLLVGAEGVAFAVKVSAGNSVGIGTSMPSYPLEVRGPASIGQIAEYVYGDLEVSGDINSANFSSGSASFSGITTFTNTTDNTLGISTSGAVQVLGGLGVDKNLTVGGGLSVTGNSYFVGVVTFAAGTDGNIVLGDTATDNVIFNADVNSNIIPNTDGAYDLGSSGQEWKDLYVDGVAYVDTLQVHENSTFTGNIDANGDLDVDGHTELDDVNVAGVSTFVGAIDANGDLDVDGRTELDITNISETLNVTGITTFENNVNVGGGLSVTGNSYFVGVVTFAAGTDGNIVLGDAATDNVVFNADVNSNIIPNTDGAYDLGSSGQEWKDLYVDGTAYIDTLQVHEGTTFTGNIDANGDLDVDGHTELDDVNVAGVSTFVGAIDANGGATIDNIQIGISDNNEIDTSSGNLTIDSAGGTTTIDDNVTVSGDTSLEGNVDLGNAVFDTITATGRFDSDLVPSTDGARDLGSSTLEWKDLYVDGVAYIDSLVADTADINAGTIDGTAIGANSASSGAFTTISASSNLTVTGNLDVDGRTDLDDLVVTGVSTFSANIDANSGITANTAKIEDLTNNRVVVAGTGGELEDDGNLTFDGSTLAVGVALDVDGQTDLDVLNVAELATFSGNLDVDGRTDLDDLVVTGVSTFSANIDANGNLDVDGRTDLDDLVVTGVSTFSANIDANGNLDVDGHTDLDDLVVTGVSTFSANIDANGNLDVDGHTDLDDLIVTGVSTLTTLRIGNTNDITSILDEDNMASDSATALPTQQSVKAYVDSQVTAQDLDFAGDSGTGAVDLDSQSLTISGTANEIETSASGQTITVGLPNNVTISGNVNAAGLNVTDKLITTGIGISVINGSNTTATIAGPATLVIDPDTVGDNTGSVRIKGDLFVDGTTTQINSTTLELADFVVGIATTATTDTLADGAGIRIGPDNTLLYENSTTSLKASENLNVATGKVYQINGTEVLSATTIGSGVVNSSLTSLGTLTGLSVSGQTSLNTLGVTGVSTFTGAIDANGDLDVDGHTELDDVNVSAASTFGGLVDINAGGQANTFKVEDLSSGRIVLAGTGGELEDSGNLTFDGTTLALTGNQTVSGDLSIADKIVHTGNTNTSIRFPSDNKVQFTTSGSPRMTLDSSGRVLIGTTGAPAGTDAQYSRLVIRGNTQSASAVAYLSLGNGKTTSDTGTNENLGILTFNDNDNDAGEYARIIGASDGANGTDDYPGKLIFSTTGDGDSAPTERMRITSGGDITVSGNLDVDGRTDLDDLVVAGVSTFSANIDANGNLDVDGHTDLDDLVVAGVSTFSANIDADGDLDVDGHTELDDLNVAGISTFVGNIDANGRIVGAATSNVIPFLYSTLSDLPSASTYHGAFAHVHATGKGYYAHAGNWIELVNRDTSGNVSLPNNLDVDGYTELDDVNVSGVTTTKTLHVGTAGTVLSVDADNSTFAIGSASNPVTATMNGGAIPSIGLVIALGG